MEGFKQFWTANAIMIGIVLTLAAVVFAYVTRTGQIAALIGAIGGIAFMWHGRPVYEDTGDDED